MENVVFYIGEHCGKKSKLYHELLHYKFRLFDRIMAKLRGDDDTVATVWGKKTNGTIMDQYFYSLNPDKGKGSKKKKKGKGTTVEKLMERESFVSNEFDRYSRKLDTTNEDLGKFK